MTDSGFDGTPALSGTVSTIVVLDPDTTPNTVLDFDLPFSLKVRWTVAPPATAALLDGGIWELRAYAESVGPGPEQQIATLTVAATGVTVYDATIPVAAKTLLPDGPNASGVYKLAVVVLYRTANNKLTEVAGYSEGPIVLVRQP